MKIKSKRYRAIQNTFAVWLTKDKVIIKNYLGRRKLHEEKHGYNIIKEYLAKQTPYDRRQYLFEIDVNNVKTDIDKVTTEEVTPAAIDSNLDAISNALIEVLKKANLYKKTFAEKVDAEVIRRKRGVVQ